MPESDLRKIAIAYHESDPPGKIAIQATKQVANQQDLGLAYSPGVAYACNDIAEDPGRVSELTARSNLVGVITNGTAVLGLGNIGPLASKPVMEGKAVLFKQFAGIDVFDIEVAETDVDAFVEAVARLEPTFGGINLEDIAAPQCFEIEKRLQQRMKIPVFHDDQHGTAIVVAAGITNGLKVVGKNIGDVKLVCSGAGASALACLGQLISLGLNRANILVCDRKGVIHKGREGNLDSSKAPFARETSARTLADAMQGADIFLGLSAGGVVSSDMVATMNDKPLIFALANPTPEITPEEIKSARCDAIIATGRTDYPNQVNNVLCFPFIFRGALDVGATTINDEMKKAAVKSLASIAQSEASDIVMSAYGAGTFLFGPEYVIPKPFDPRLITEIAPAVAKAAMDSGVATRPIKDFDDYREKLSEFVWRSGIVMKPIFDAAKHASKTKMRRLVFAEGEHPYVLQATQQLINEGIARPILIGRPDKIERLLPELGLRIRPGRDFDIFDQTSDERAPQLVEEYLQLVERRGVSPRHAKRVLRVGSTVVAGLLLRRGDADAMICGMVGRFQAQLRHVSQVVGRRRGVRSYATLSSLILPTGVLFMADTYVTHNPSAEQLAEITMLACEEIRNFGIEPKVALVSHSNFGTEDTATARKMRDTLGILVDWNADLEVEGEMHADSAILPFVRNKIFPNSRLKGAANLLIMPGVDAANIAYTLLKAVNRGVSISPILLGTAHPVHIVVPSISVRGLVNMASMAVADSQRRADA